MHDYTLAHVRDDVLLRDLAALIDQERVTIATVLVHIAEVDARRLYIPGGHPSMFAYCVDELRLSEDAAYKRIQAARAARQFPVLFAALAEGRLHLAAVCLLAPHLTADNVEELVQAATHRRKADVEELLAVRFSPRSVAATVRPVANHPLELAPGQVDDDWVASFEALPDRLGNREIASGEGELAPGQVETPRSEKAERYLLKVTIGKSTRDRLRHAQALLSHAVPSGDVAQVLDRALVALIGQLEKRKIGAGTGRRSAPPVRSRHIPASVRRAVWGRDQGQCTFISASGHRCAARRFLEFDHLDPVARGGKATVEGMRLRCRAHNQYEAERIFGADFMSRKREERRIATAEARASAAQEKVARERTAQDGAAKEQARDVLVGLRNLGIRADQARRAAEYSETLPVATLEDRMRAALQFLSPRRNPGMGQGEGIPIRD